jgi:hypothetical protein
MAPKKRQKTVVDHSNNLPLVLTLVDIKDGDGDEIGGEKRKKVVLNIMNARYDTDPFLWFIKNENVKWKEKFLSPAKVFLEKHQQSWGQFMEKPEHYKALQENAVTAMLPEGDTAMPFVKDLVIKSMRNIFDRSVVGESKQFHAAKLEKLLSDKAFVDLFTFKNTENKWWVTLTEYAFLDKTFNKLLNRKDFFVVPDIDIEVTPHQKDIFGACLTHLREKGFSALSGGGGVGKTHIISEFLKVLTETEVPSRSFTSRRCPKCECTMFLRLCNCGFELDDAPVRKIRLTVLAPTNRAVAVALEKIRGIACVEFGTLHQLCSRKVQHESDVVIIDESSMMGIDHQELLAKSPSLWSAALLFVGDHIQLPPICRGEIFRFVLHMSNLRPLTQNMRVTDESLCNLISDVRDGKILELEAITQNLSESADRWKVVYDNQHNAVLCLRNAEKDSFNIFCMKKKSPPIPENLTKFDEYVVSDKESPRLFVPFVGLPVVFCTNDMKPNATKSTLGVVKSVVFGYEWVIEVAVDKTDVVIKASPFALPSYIKPAYAITVHSAQGFEADNVGVVLTPSRHSPLLTLQMAYTACSRAKKDLVIYTIRDGLLSMDKLCSPEPERNTFLRLGSL